MVIEPIFFAPSAADARDFELSVGTIHVWHLHIPTLRPYLDAWVTCLSGEECDRMSRFVFERDRIKYGLSRGGLRQLLGRYARREPAALTFEYEAKGKPHLCLDGQPSPLQFNLSHSGDWVAYGVSRACTLGIDIEHIRPLRNLESLAQYCLTPTEGQALAPLSTEQAQAQFFAYWTSKEAYLKATGQGLTRTLSQIKTDLDTAQIFPALDDPNFGPPWHLHRWTPATGYAAALVHCGDRCAVRHLDYGTWIRGKLAG